MMARGQGHGAAGRVRVADGVHRIGCACGWSHEGTRRQCDQMIRAHWDEAFTWHPKPDRSPRSVDDGAVRPLHVMARERGA